MISALHYVSASLLLGWSLLTVVPTPVRLLWKPAVAATEWGHWLASFSVLFALFDYVLGLGPSTLALHLSAAALFVSPTVRAVPLARVLPGRLRTAFGEQPSQESQPAPRPGPIVAKDLAHIPLPKVDQTRHVYSEVAGQELVLDLYRPDDRRRCRATVVVVHGGSWNSGDSSQLTGLSRYLAGRGYAVAAINYRLAPTYPFPAAYEDVGVSIAFIKEHAADLNVDAERIVLLGRSSGGHLALLSSYLDADSVRGVVAFYAPTDMRWSWARPAPKRLMDSRGVMREFLGGSPEEVADRFDQASPINFVSASSPPTLLLHGGRDELVSPLQSRRLADVLKQKGVPHLHIELPWARHGMDANLAGPSGQITTYAVEHFISAVTG